MIMKFWLVLTIAAIPAASIPAAAQLDDDPLGLWGRATLYRDEWGVPHIQADDLRAMAFALGYAQAEDHAEKMLTAYRIVSGHAAELLGEAYAPSDEFALQMAHSDLAQAAYGDADDVTRDLCEGFALGVNAWLFDQGEGAPRGADGVSPADPLTLLHAFLMSMAPFDFSDIEHPQRGMPSGNAWAVAPERTKEGRPLLVMNPHANYDGPFQWYECHLAVSDWFNVSGATLFGLPMVLMGHNGHAGWALSPNDPDFGDLYVQPSVQFARDPKSLMSDGPADSLYWLKLAADSIPYYVATENGTLERRVPRLMTGRGPVIGRLAGRNLAYRVGGYGEFGALRQMFDMARASNVDEIQQALAQHQLPCFHVVAADADGGLLYTYNARVGEKLNAPMPVESGGAPRTVITAWDAPVSAEDPLFDWGALVRPDQLPRIVNPASGYVQACATPPWLATDDTGMTRDDFPLWFARDTDSYRARRVRQLLARGERTLEDMQAMLFDVVAPFAVDAAPYLVRLADAQPEFVSSAHPDLVVALDMLRDWDHVASADSTAMTYFHIWWSVFRNTAPFPAYTDSDLYAHLESNSSDVDQHALWAANEAARLMRNEYQTLGVPWGEVHQLEHGEHKYPMPGGYSGEPIFAADDYHFEDGRWRVKQGYGFAMAAELGDHPRAMSIVPFGASDDSNSPHYRDQVDLFLDSRMKPAYFEWDDVRGQARSVTGMRAALASSDGLVRIDARSTAPARWHIEYQEEASEEELPGMAQFSEGVSMSVGPSGVPTEITYEFQIPESVCSAAYLDHLRVYAEDSAEGWFEVPGQELDAAARTLWARLDTPLRCAVFGPAQYRINSGSPPRSAPIVPTPVGYRGLRPRPLTIAKTPEADEAQGPDVRRNFNMKSPGSSEEKTEVESPSVEPIDAISHADAEGPAPIPPARDQPQTDAKETPPSDPFAVASADGPRPKKGGLTFSGKSFEELVGPRRSEPVSFRLVPDYALASGVVIGQSLNLQPPVPGVMFHVTTDKTIRAQVMVLDSPPAMPPEGLTAFTQSFEIRTAGATVTGATAVSISVPRDRVNPAQADQLKLYSFGIESGWELIPGQKYDPQGLRFTGLDPAIRSYAVLGPESARADP